MNIVYVDFETFNAEEAERLTYNNEVIKEKQESENGERD